MKSVETGIEGLLVLEPKVFRDPRGYFIELFNERTMALLGLNYRFVQDNESQSSYGTLRGLHFQKGASAQAKLVRAVLGEVLDVAVDLRPGSKTYGKHFSVVLNEENKKMLMIPRGFAHGFAVLSPTAIFSYKCDNFYAPADEGGIHYADPDLSIDWRLPKDKILVSDKDAKYSGFKAI